MQFPIRFAIFAVTAIASLSFVSAAPAKVENLPEKVKREGCYTDPDTGDNICTPI
jgi:hypothetical protein